MIEAYRRTGRMDGRCLCGAVSIAIDGPYVAAIGVCHCSMCQRWNGMIYGSFDAEADAVTVTGAVTRHASSGFSERAFCTTCGSHLWLRNTDKAGQNYEFAPGLFPAARDFPVVSEIYIDRAPAYAALSGDHRRATRADYERNNLFLAGDMP